MTDTYTSKDIQKMTGMSPRQILYLSEKIPHTPEIRDSCGRGSTKIYSEWDLFKLFLGQEMISAGLDFPFVAKIMPIVEKLYREHNNVFKACALHIRGNRYAYITDGHIVGKPVDLNNRKRKVSEAAIDGVFESMRIQVDLSVVETKINMYRQGLGRPREES